MRRSRFSFPFTLRAARFSLLLSPLFLLAACGAGGGNKSDQPDYAVVEGKTMGTYYRVTFQDVRDRDLKPVLDSTLQALNMEVSTYIPEATISRFNQADSVYNLNTDPYSGEITSYANDHFLANYRKSVAVAAKTNGFFDPTVMPLVNYWGFGYTEKKPVEAVDSATVDSLARLVGMDKVELKIFEDSKLLIKALPGVKLDFSAIAKGYGVDLLGQLLDERGIEHYLVDIGGETLAKGESPRGDAWKLGISMPKETAALNAIQTSVPLRDQALATSGNYRNFYEVNGIKYSHTINPKTGYPERNTLLSASVFAADCTTADAYATAFMTMGTERAYELANSIPNLEAYFLFSREDGSIDMRSTPGLNNLFKHNQ